mgnify:CR=1 FL=1|jgi:predicted nucleotidyltransferase
MFTVPQVKEVEKACRRAGVVRLEGFGSAARGEERPDSDVDLLVRFDSDLTDNAFNAYFDLKEELERLFGQPVDLVCADALHNQAFRAAVEKEKTLLFAR